MKKLTIASMAVVLLLSACGPTLKVTSDYDRQANFSAYKTFAYYNPGGDKSSVSELNRSRIENAIIAQMKAKGYTEETDTSAADLLVNPITVTKEGKSVTANTDYYGYGGFYRPYGWGGGFGNVSSTTNYSVDKYIDGSLIVDVVDRAKRTMLWQGVGNSEIDGPLKDPDTQIPKAVAKIMSSFPTKQ